MQAITPNIEIPILFEDDAMLVINKPAGIVVNRAESVKEKTVQDWIEPRLKINDLRLKNGENKDFIERSGIVHRLDKETSGCLLIAKNLAAFTNLQTQFKNRIIKKEYLSLIHGKIESTTGEISVPVGRLPWNKEKFGIVLGGKPSQTFFKALAYYEKNQQLYTLLQLNPTSGRTHQIRVHLKYLNHPIVGDYLYAGRKQQLKDRTWCPRVFLHAAKITFNHPTSHITTTIEAKLPTDLEQVLDKMSQIN